MSGKRIAQQVVKLTNESVKALPFADKGKHYVYDSERRGFCVRVTPSSKFYAVRLKLNGEDCQRSIGRVEELTAVAARNRAEVIIGELRSGIDRNKERRAAIHQARAAKATAQAEALAAPTVSSSLADYLSKRKLKPRTVADYNGILGRELKSWANKPLHEIDRHEVELKFRELTDIHGESRAAQAMRILRAICKNSKDKVGLQDWGKLFPKPKVAKTGLRHADGKIIYKALVDFPNPLAASEYILAVLLTGARRTEMAEVLVGDVGPGARTITLRDTKNGKDHVIQCSTQLRAIIEPLTKDQDGDKRPADAKLFGLCGDPRKTLKSINKTVQEAADIAAENGAATIDKSFSLHSLRKLCAITLNHLRIPHATIKAVLNHTPDARDVTALNYITVDEEEMLMAWQALGDYYSATTAHVIQLPTIKAAA